MISAETGLPEPPIAQPLVGSKAHDKVSGMDVIIGWSWVWKKHSSQFQLVLKTESSC